MPTYNQPGAVNTDSAILLGGESPLLLIHSDTTNGSTTFVDSSAYEVMLTANGNVQHSTAQNKFGASSISFIGQTGYLTPSTSVIDAISSGPFTIDLWVYFPDVSDTDGNAWDVHALCSCNNNSDNSSNQIYVGGGGNVRYIRQSSHPGGYHVVETSGGLIQDATWHHVALVADGTTWYIFVDGVQQASATSTTYFAKGNLPFEIGRQYIPSYSSYAAYYKGYIDEFRILPYADPRFV